MNVWAGVGVFIVVVLLVVSDLFLLLKASRMQFQLEQMKHREILVNRRVSTLETSKALMLNRVKKLEHRMSQWMNTQ